MKLYGGIWRYMDLWKFLDIIQNDQLYMSRVDTFEDKFEGLIANESVQKIVDNKHPLKQINNFSNKYLTKSSYVSSCNKEIEETYPLWKIYTDYRMAVSIKTNLNRLIESLKNDSENDQYIGNVEYLKFKNNQYAFSVNTFQLFFQKRNYFKFENGVRILTDLKWKSPNEIFSFPKGIKINIDPKILIEEIKLAPLADENFKILIEEILKIQNIDVPVTYSLI